MKLTRTQFQRAVYSSHLLGFFDAKPELEGGLLALLELADRNRAPRPRTGNSLTLEDKSTHLAGPVMWALNEYRREASNATLTIAWRDMVLARYFLKVCDAPGLAADERRGLALDLLNSLLAQEDASSPPGQEAGRFHVGAERLLAVANGPGKRQAVVKSCMRRAERDSNFAAAMDALLRPEIGIALDAPPAAIFAANRALAQSPTMRELMRAGSSSEDGSVVITTAALDDLAAAELAVARDAARTYCDVQRRIVAARDEALGSSGDAARLALMIQAHAAQQANETQRIAAASAAATTLSDLTLSEGSTKARKLEGTSKVIALLGTGFFQMTRGAAANAIFGPWGAVAGGATSLLAAGVQLVGMAEQGEPPDQTILESVKLVGELISDLSDRVDYRFDRVDASLRYILKDLSQTVLLIGDVQRNVHQVRNDLARAQASLDTLERQVDSYLSAGFARELQQHINGDLGFEARNHEAMSWKRYSATAGPENAFHTWAVLHAKDDLASPIPGAEDLKGARLLVQLESRPLDRNLNYIKTFLKDRLGASSLPAGPVPNLADWYAGASAYVRLAAENPQHFRRTNRGRLERVIRVGTELQDFFRAMTFVDDGPGGGIKVNYTLYDAVLSYYENSLEAFNAALADAEKTVRANEGGINGSMWRDWESRARRLTVAETAVVIGGATTGMRVVGAGTHLSLPQIPTDVVGMATSGYHSLAIRRNRTVVAWGDNTFRQCDVPAGLRDVIAVSAGFSHSLALTADGTIVAWGDNRRGQCDIPAHDKPITKISAGHNQSLALQADGAVIAWGSNDYHACDVPEQAKGGVVDIVASSTPIGDGGDVSLALKSDGTVVSWGRVLRADRKRVVPQPFTAPQSLSKIAAIGAGYGRMVAVKRDGTVVGLDYGLSGSSPLRSVNDVAAVALGSRFTLALKRNGTVEVIGGSLEGTPPQGAFAGIAAGGDQALAWRRDGTLVAWPPRGLWQGTRRVVNIFKSGLGRGQLFLTEDGRLASPRLQVPPGLDDVVAASVEYRSCLALKANGEVVAWELGPEVVAGRTTPRVPPAQLSRSKDVIAIATSGTHSLALRTDGTVEAWGLNSSGQYPSDADGVVAIAAGLGHSLALRANGTVRAWGNYLFDAPGLRPLGWIAKPDVLDDVVAISAGDFHDLALRANGTVVAWGNNSDGQCDVPKGLAGVVGIAAGNDWSLALKADGTVAAWGRNDTGKCSFAAAQTGVLALARSGESAAFLLSRTTPTVANAGPLPFMMSEPPPAAMLRLRELNAHVLNNLAGDLAKRPAGARDLNDSLDQLTGAKVLVQSVIALGLSDSLDQDYALRGLLFGPESVIDRDGVRALYEAERRRLETDWRVRPSTLATTPRARLDSLRRGLRARLDTLERSGTPEVPRMLARTLLHLRLLRAAY